MKLLALIEAPDHVCYRYRLAAFAPALECAGWQLEAVPLSANTLVRVRQLRAAAAADAVVLQRKLLPFWQLNLLRRSARKLIYDFDDAVFHRDWHATKGPASWQRLAHFWATIYASDLVLAGNQYLYDTAATYSDPERVRLAPTCIDPRRYPIAQHERTGAAVRLAWIGQQSTLVSLQSPAAEWQAVAQRLPGLEVRVICDAFPQLPGLRVTPRTWSAETEASELADADIGVSWLPDHPWSLGKCALKVLQYMAASLPVVANPVGIHRQLVIPGETGFLAASPAEWAEAIARLAGDPALRAKMGAAAREMVARQYSVERWGSEWQALLGRAPQREAAGRPAMPLAIATK